MEDVMYIDELQVYLGRPYRVNDYITIKQPTVINTARCIRKRCSVFSRICWELLRATMPKQKDEICLDGKDEIIVDWEISREVSNRNALNDYRLKYR